MERTFTVTKVSATTGRLKSSDNHGTFNNKTPVAAAKKAVTKICKNSSIKGRCTLKITVQETQEDGTVKDFSYKISRILNPVTVVRDGKEINHKYSLKATAIKKK
jgi:hypothetical protein